MNPMAGGYYNPAAAMAQNMMGMQQQMMGGMMGGMGM